MVWICVSLMAGDGDEHWVLHATDELSNTTAKASDVLYVG